MKVFNSTRLWLFFLAVISAFAPLSSLAQHRPIAVAVSILPQAFFVEAIAGPATQVTVMVPPGASPASYEPRPRELAGLARCSVYFAQGLPFESAWLPRFLKTNPHIHVVKCYRGIERLPINAEPGLPRKTSKTPGQPDPHVWLSPPLALLEARNILDGLLRADPARWEDYQKNFRRLACEIVDLDLRISKLFKGLTTHNSFLVYHPAWGYFARTYGLNQVAVEKRGRKPLVRELKQLIEYARTRGFKELFVQPQISAHEAQVIAQAIGARIVTLDPLARKWDKNLLKSAESIRRALR